MYNMNQFYKLHLVERIVVVGNVEMTPPVYLLSVLVFDFRLSLYMFGTGHVQRESKPRIESGETRGDVSKLPTTTMRSTECSI